MSKSDLKDEKLVTEEKCVEILPAGDPVTKPKYGHLFNEHPKPETALTIRKLLLTPALNVPLNIVGLYVINWGAVDLGEYQFVKFYIAAGIASIVVNVPLYVRLSKACSNPQFYYVGYGPTPQPGDCPSYAAEWQPRRITHSAKLRYIIPLMIVAALWLLPTAVLVVSDIPPLISMAREAKVWNLELPVWKWIGYRLAAGVLFCLLFVAAAILSIPFVVQARICYNCVLEKHEFYALNITRRILAVLDLEKAAAAEEVTDITLVDTT